MRSESETETETRTRLCCKERAVAITMSSDVAMSSIRIFLFSQKAINNNIRNNGKPSGGSVAATGSQRGPADDVTFYSCARGFGELPPFCGGFWAGSMGVDARGREFGCQGCHYAGPD